MDLSLSVLTKLILLRLEALKVSVVVAEKLNERHGYIHSCENVHSCQNFLRLSGKHLNYGFF